MRGKLVVGRVGPHWAVFRDGVRITGLLGSIDRAEARRDTIRRAEARKPRGCLCCGQRFVSDGPHNRMCKHCRRRDPEPDLAMVGGVGSPARTAGE